MFFSHLFLIQHMMYFKQALSSFDNISIPFRAHLIYQYINAHSTIFCLFVDIIIQLINSNTQKRTVFFIRYQRHLDFFP